MLVIHPSSGEDVLRIRVGGAVAGGMVIALAPPARLPGRGLVVRVIALVWVLGIVVVVVIDTRYSGCSNCAGCEGAVCAIGRPANPPIRGVPTRPPVNIGTISTIGGRVIHIIQGVPIIQV